MEGLRGYDIIFSLKLLLAAILDWAAGRYIPWFFNICLGARSRLYCRYTKSPLGTTPLTEIWESPWIKEDLTSVGFEPMTSGLDLPKLYRLSYEVSTRTGWGNLGSESRLMYKWYRYIVREPRSTQEIGNYTFLIYVWVPEVGNTADTPNPHWVLLL